MPRKRDSTTPTEPTDALFDEVLAALERRQISRQRDRTPDEVLLDEVISNLEDGEAPRAVMALVMAGPFFCQPVGGAGPLYSHPVDVEAFDQQPEEIATIADALLAYVRGIVHTRIDRTHPAPSIAMSGTVQFSPLLLENGRIVTFAKGAVRDLAVLQFERLLDLVGLRNIHVCGAENCSHLFVKTYRREFCSERCQKRTYKRRSRQEAREQAARNQARRQRRRQQ